jgi:hypothetical protein
MAEADSLLKRLVGTLILDFSTWLLRANARAARPLQSELPGATVAVHQVFQGRGPWDGPPGGPPAFVRLCLDFC